jgi:hypothetical protein
MLTIRVVDPYADPVQRTFFYKGGATRYDGPCLIRTGRSEGCAKGKYRI